MNCIAIWRGLDRTCNLFGWRPCWYKGDIAYSTSCVFKYKKKMVLATLGLWVHFVRLIKEYMVFFIEPFPFKDTLSGQISSQRNKQKIVSVVRTNGLQANFGSRATTSLEDAKISDWCLTYELTLTLFQDQKSPQSIGKLVLSILD